MTRLMEHYSGLRWRQTPLPFTADLEGLDEANGVVKEFDPRKLPWYPTIFDQLQLGSCTANADNACVEADRNLDAGKKLPHISRLWTYYGERDLEGSLGQGDTGAYGSDGFKWLAKDGCLPESNMPYNIAKFQVPPTTSQYSLAKVHPFKKKTAVVAPSTANFHKVLGNKQFISFGFQVDANFEDQSAWTTGPGDDPNVMPTPTGDWIGGHQIVAVGFLEKYPYHLLCRNSWSAGWQKDGHFLFPIKTLCNRTICSDFTTIVRPL